MLRYLKGKGEETKVLNGKNTCFYLGTINGLVGEQMGPKNICGSVVYEGQVVSFQLLCSENSPREGICDS